MTVRAVWLIRTESPSQTPSIMYSRTFSLVESKCKAADGDLYVPLPKNEKFLQHIILHVGKSNNTKFLAGRDSCVEEDEKPIFGIDLGNGNKLWPIIAFEQSGILYCCLCYIDRKLYSESKTPLITMPSISLGFSLLRCLTDFFCVSSSHEVTAKLNDLPAFMNEIVTFGVPTDNDYDSAISKLLDRQLTIHKVQKIKQPAWKPVLHKGKSNIFLSVSECIQATQCEQEEVKDMWNVYGTITCKAEIDGATPDVTLNISHLKEGFMVPLDSLFIHPCVQSADSSRIAKDVKVSPRRIRFTPLSDNFTLCNYTVTRIQELPIFGVFQMKGDFKTANVSVKLQLTDQIKNNFEYAELQIPFFDRNVISIIDSNLSQGSLTISADRSTLVWNIGPKFPTKSLDASLTAVIQLVEKKALDSNLTSEADYFCNGLNTYCQLFFKVCDFTYSGCYIDPKSVQVSPNTKFKLTTKREFVSTTYKIWNSGGNVLTIGQ